MNFVKLVLAQVEVIANPRQKLFWLENEERFNTLINWPEDEKLVNDYTRSVCVSHMHKRTRVKRGPLLFPFQGLVERFNSPQSLNL